MVRQLNEQKYCGWCGSEVQYKAEWMSECTACGFQRYFNPSACTNFIVVKGDSVLMVQRAIEPQKGLLDFAGGFVDMADESMEDAAYRELWEEVGLAKDDVEPLQYIGSHISPPYLWQDTEIRNMSFYFIGKIKDEDKELDLDTGENSAFRWVTKDDLSGIDFAWDIDKVMLTKYFKENL